MKFLFLIFLFPLQVLAQDISGVWKGTLYNDTTKQYLQYELAINDNNGKLTGYSYTIFMIDGLKNVGVKSVKIKKGKDGFQVEDDKLIYNNYPEPPAKGVRTFSNLSFSEKNNIQVLSGSWNTNKTREYNSLTGTLSLERKTVFTETLIIPKLDEMGLIKNLAFVTPDYKTNQTAGNISSSTSQTQTKKTSPDQADIKSITTIAPTKNDSRKEKNIENTSLATKEINTNNDLVAANKKDLQKPTEVETHTAEIAVNTPTKNDLQKEKTNENTSLAEREINTNKNQIAAQNQDSQKSNQVETNTKELAINPQLKNGAAKQKKIENTSLSEREINTNRNQISGQKQDSQNPNQVETNTRELAINAPKKNDLQKEKKNENSSSAKEEINNNKNLIAANKKDLQKPNQVETNATEIAVNTPTKNDLEKGKKNQNTSLAKNEINTQNNLIAANKQNSKNTNQVETNTTEIAVNTPTKNDLEKDKKNQNTSLAKNAINTQNNLIAANKKDSQKTNQVETNTKEIAIIPQTKNDLQKEKSIEISSSVKEKTNLNNNVIAATKKDSEKANTVAGIKKEVNITPTTNTTLSEKNKNTLLSPEKKIFSQTVNELPANQTEFKSKNFNSEAPIKSPTATILAAADIASRKIETIQTVEIKQDSLVFSLFDNGIIDGDTVSILINGVVIWPRVGLLATATNKTIYLTPEMGDSIFVVMYAENLGSIPPNTGLLVIREGNIDHEIRFSGDLKKNSAIILKRKKKE